MCEDLEISVAIDQLRWKGSVSEVSRWLGKQFDGNIHEINMHDGTVH